MIDHYTGVNDVRPGALASCGVVGVGQVDSRSRELLITGDAGKAP